MKTNKVIEVVEGYNSEVFEGTLEECKSKKIDLEYKRKIFVEEYIKKCPGKNVSNINYTII